MSLYKLVMGMSPVAGVVLTVLGLSAEDIGRFRDTFVKVEDGVPLLGVYARIGGSYREAYQWVFDALSKHELYLRDEDAEHDSTYATIWFKAPANLHDTLVQYEARFPYKSPELRFQEVLASLES